MSTLLTPGDIVATWARLTPDRMGARDLSRTLTFRQWNARACRLANALIAAGLGKGERVAVLAYNCVEWMEIYVAVAKAGLIVVPVNFRLAEPEIRHIIEDCQARALIFQSAFRETVDSIRLELPIPDDGYVCIAGKGGPPGEYMFYEELLARFPDTEPRRQVAPEDPWALMYTSGTTGHPKGGLRNLESCALLSLVTALDMGFSRDDTALLVMPMCHANSLFFAFSFTYLGAACFVYDRSSFDPEHLLRTMSDHRITFTSLVPTHYIMMEDLPTAVKRKYRCDDVKRLMISSAPARRETKLAIMEQFANSGLFELYASSEAGWVTLLRPDEQLTHLESVGREWTGTGPVRLLDDEGLDVPDGEIGELYSRTPYAFTEYWNLPDKTAAAFRGAWCTVGDLARRDDQGFYYLVDRKSNMIISGGENIYPSEVEAVVGAHPKVRDVAVIGVPDRKWGETVRAVVVLREGVEAGEDELLDWCRERIAGFKRPRSVVFLDEREMPRTATGKIQHRLLKQRWRDA